MEGDRKICYRHIPKDCGHAGTATACGCVCWTVCDRSGSAKGLLTRAGMNCTETRVERQATGLTF